MKNIPATARPRYLSLVVTHLNASTGPLLTVHELAAALCSGSAYGAGQSPQASALILSLFHEATPHQILSCLDEVGADIASVERLYQQARADNMPAAPAWEQATRHLQS